MNTYWLKKLRKRFDFELLVEDKYMVIDHLKKRSFRVDLGDMKLNFFRARRINEGIAMFLLREYFLSESRYDNHLQRLQEREWLSGYRESCIRLCVQPRCSNHNEDSIN